jgi:hypothetical protein
MERDELRIRELEKEIVETDACIREVRSRFSSVPPSDPAYDGARTLVSRLMQARTDAHRSFCALVEGVEMRPVQH